MKSCIICGKPAPKVWYHKGQVVMGYTFTRDEVMEGIHEQCWFNEMAKKIRAMEDA